MPIFKRRSEWTKVKKTLESDIVHYLEHRARIFQDNEARELMNRLGTGFTDNVIEAEQKFGKEVKR